LSDLIDRKSYEATMTQIRTVLTGLAAAMLLSLMLGCASSFQEKENLAVAAGFRAISPSRPEQASILATLPANRITPVNYRGKVYYVLPDVRNNQAFVGGPKQYQAYQQLRLARQISNENLEAAQLNADASMNWDTWGGWGALGGPGWY
jgi:hypothetical protein